MLAFEINNIFISYFPKMNMHPYFPIHSIFCCSDMPSTACNLFHTENDISLVVVNNMCRLVMNYRKMIYNFYKIEIQYFFQNTWIGSPFCVRIVSEQNESFGQSWDLPFWRHSSISRPTQDKHYNYFQPAIYKISLPLLQICQWLSRDSDFWVVLRLKQEV